MNATMNRKPRRPEKTADITAFSRAILPLYNESIAAGRVHRGVPYLDYEQWHRWGAAAVAAGFVTSGELNGEADPGLTSNVFRIAILRTWERVAESMQSGLSAEQHFRNDLAAIKQRDLIQEQRDREAAAARAPKAYSTSARKDR